MDYTGKCFLLAALLGLASTQYLGQSRQQPALSSFDQQYPSLGSFEQQPRFSQQQDYFSQQPIQQQQPLEQPTINQQPYKGPDYYRQPQLPQFLPQQYNQPDLYQQRQFYNEPELNKNLFTPASPEDAYASAATPGQINAYRKALQDEEAEARGQPINQQQSIDIPQQQQQQQQQPLRNAQRYSGVEGRQPASSYVNVQYGPNQGYSFDIGY